MKHINWKSSNFAILGVIGIFILCQAFGECQENNPVWQRQAARRKSSGQVQTSGSRGWSPQAILALSQRSFGNPNSHDTWNSRQTDARTA